ncbi:MAG: hypothetical protein K940chlam9_01441 [Chlamydiae bacterium]|nr:hypothetical protein [Chlamydiota bacterium]
MKKLALLAIVLSFCTACNRAPQNHVVKETYIHKYGVPCSQSDWEMQGREGQIVRLGKDGVTKTETYHQGILEEETTYTFPHSSLIAKIETYRGGELVGVKEHYMTGVPSVEKVFSDGVLAEVTCWYEDGAPAYTEKYSGGVLEIAEYRTTLNELEGRVHGGQGIRVRRSTTGDLLAKEMIEGGKRVESTIFYPSGEPKEIIPFRDGHVHGTKLTFLAGGVPLAAEEFVGGMREGKTTLYQNGDKVAEVTYMRGKKHGMELRFRDGVDLVEEICWQNDIQHGPTKLYIDGEARTEWYHQGGLVNRATFERMNFPR